MFINRQSVFAMIFDDSHILTDEEVNQFAEFVRRKGYALDLKDNVGSLTHGTMQITRAVCEISGVECDTCLAIIID